MLNDRDVLEPATDQSRHCTPTPELRARIGSARGVARAGPTLAAIWVGALFWSLATLDASAHGGATGIVKERMDAMSKVGDASEIIGDMVKRKRPLEPAQVRSLALQMRQHATRIPELFPDTQESREGRGTEALPAIWARWSEFEALTIKLERDSGALAEAAQREDPRAIRKQFVAVAKTCRGCHTEFRRPKDD